MTSTGSESAEARLESLLKPYRDLSNEHMELIWTEFAAEHPAGSFPSTKTMRQNSRLFLAGKRYRFALALAGYRLLMGDRPSRDLERAATWLEWYHLYTLFLDDIMDEDFRRRTFPSAWSSNARLYRGADAARPATVFRTRRRRAARDRLPDAPTSVRGLAGDPRRAPHPLPCGGGDRARGRPPSVRPVGVARRVDDRRPDPQRRSRPRHRLRTGGGHPGGSLRPDERGEDGPPLRGSGRDGGDRRPGLLGGPSGARGVRAGLRNRVPRS